MKRQFILVLSCCILFGDLNMAQTAELKIKVACIGNSITYGYGTDNSEIDSYPAQLQQMLGERYEVGNFGKPGATLLNKGHCPYVQQEEFRDAMAFAGDVAVIHLGINDTDPRNWPNYRDDFVQDYMALIDSCRSVNPRVRVIVCRLTPIFEWHPRFESSTRDWEEEVQQAVESVAAAAHVELLDFHEVLYAYPNLLPDALHPNKEGLRLIARAVYAAITGDYGGLKLPDVYGDHMVLQCGRPLKINGTDDAGATVTVTIGGQQHNTTAGLDGKWDVVLAPMEAGTGYILKVTDGKQTLTYHDVAVGEVWLCSGQSNMEFHLGQSLTASRDIPQAENKHIRLFDMKGRWATDNTVWTEMVLDSVNRLQYYAATAWEPCTPSHAASFSAVAYYFGKMLQDSLQVPIGLICNAVGGSPTEAWVDRRSIEHHMPSILYNWPRNDYVQRWVKERALTNMNNGMNELQRHPYAPCYLYESAILPLRHFPIRGVIWYQGESNAHNILVHEKLFAMLVNGWRDYWQNPDMPFYYVQLSSLNRPSWPRFRDSQRQLMQQLPHTGMAVSLDKGDSLDVHPRDKQPIGERLARWALNRDYGFDLLPSGPLYKSATLKESRVYIDFDYGDGLCTSDGMPPSCFEVAEIDGLYYPATTLIEDDKIVVWSDKVPHPVFVRYAWQPYTQANVVNKDLLPASTFCARIE